MNWPLGTYNKVKNGSQHSLQLCPGPEENGVQKEGERQTSRTEKSVLVTGPEAVQTDQEVDSGTGAEGSKGTRLRDVCWLKTHCIL